MRYRFKGLRPSFFCRLATLLASRVTRALPVASRFARTRPGHPQILVKTSVTTGEVIAHYTSVMKLRKAKTKDAGVRRHRNRAKGAKR